MSAFCPEFAERKMNNLPQLSCYLPLPSAFRVADMLDFHGRDTMVVAERIDGRCLHKGLIWEGRAACLTICFRPGCAEVRMDMDGGAGEAVTGEAALAQMVRHMLGLTQRVEDFEQACRSHPHLGPLIVRQAGLRVPLSATPFEALTWAIAGQQISTRAALSLRRKLILAAGARHSGGLACYPDAARVACLGEGDLRQAGFSQTKARALLVLSQAVAAGSLPLAAWQVFPVPVEEIRTQLLAVRGIGPWTVNYALLRGFGWLDGSLHGDAGVRRGLQTLFGRPEKVSEAQAERWLAGFSPWRALVAAHLWASLG
jgi:DNA-3-methyladenine glycosylase II